MKNPLKKILSFIFGKEPSIFNKKGEVEHHFPKTKWKKWQNRIQNNPDYNWRHHLGNTSDRKGPHY